MNPWDIDPNLDLTVFRLWYRSLRERMHRQFAWWRRPAQRPAGCRG